MFLIQQVINTPLQRQNLILSDGSFLTLTIRFVPLQYGWFIDSLTYQDFTLNGMRIVNSPNMLHQYRNKIPFGLACYSTANREPSQQNDFISGASQLYILSEAETLAFTRLLEGG